MSHRPRSIVFLVPGFPKDESDTACLPAVQNYVAAFARARPEVQTHVIAFQYPFVRDTYRWNHVTVHALAGKNRPGMGRAWTWLRAVRAFLKIHRQTSVRVLHSFWLTECTWVACRLSQIFRIRHVASIAGQDARAGNPYTSHLRLGAALLTAGSRFAAETFTRHTGRAVDHIIPLGLDTHVLQRIERSTPRDIDLLGVGSLIPVKDYAAFLDVVAALVSDFPHLKSCIVGDGPQRGALRGRIAEQGLQQHVRLAGSLCREDTFRTMLRSKVFLHTARYEGQGYVFLEALFAGLPVVCFDVGYTGESDRVFRCRSWQEMTDTAANLLHHPPAFNPVPVCSVDDTVQAFEPLYELFSDQHVSDR